MPIIPPRPSRRSMSACSPGSAPPPMPRAIRRAALSAPARRQAGGAEHAARPPRLTGQFLPVTPCARPCSVPIPVPRSAAMSHDAPPPALERPSASRCSWSSPASAHRLRRAERPSGLFPGRLRGAATLARRGGVRRSARPLPVPARPGLEPARLRHRPVAARGARRPRRLARLHLAVGGHDARGRRLRHALRRAARDRPSPRTEARRGRGGGTGRARHGARARARRGPRHHRDRRGGSRAHRRPVRPDRRDRPRGPDRARSPRRRPHRGLDGRRRGPSRRNTAFPACRGASA